MRVAMLADIHANLQALDEVLAAAQRQGAQRYIVLGDLIGYGGDPGPVVERMMALQADGAVIVRGNHDDLDCDPDREMHLVAAEAAKWSRAQLSPSQQAFLRALPLTVREGDRLYVHADAVAPEKWRYVLNADAAARSLAATDARLVFCGHVHTPKVYALGSTGQANAFDPVANKALLLLSQRRWHVVLGSVGQPRNRDPAASFAMFNERDASLTFHRVAYDVAAAARRIREAGLSEMLASRLFDGR